MKLALRAAPMSMKLLSRPLAVPRWVDGSQAARIIVALGSRPAWKTPISSRPPMRVNGATAAAHKTRERDQPTVQQTMVERGPTRWASQPAGAWRTA